jgi:long-subunit fatty acid transport protein
MLLVGFSVVFLSAGVGQAFNVESMAVHARALGLANTCTADPPRIMAIHYNPAALARLEGTQVDVGITYADVEVTSRFKRGSGYTDPTGTGVPDPVADTAGTSHKACVSVPFMQWMSPLIAPNLGVSYQPKDSSRWTFAYGIYAPFGLGVAHGEVSAIHGGQGNWICWRKII